MRRIENIIMLLVLAVAMLVSANTMQAQSKDEGTTDYNFESVKNLDIFHSLYKELYLYYVDPIEPEKLIKTAIDKMLEGLDPYTVYIPENQIEDIKLITTGQYGGIGALIRQDGDYVMITDPYENSPAAKAGIIAGDKILEIDAKKFDKKYNCNLAACKKSRNQMQFVTSIVTQMLKYSNKNEIIDW